MFSMDKLIEQKIRKIIRESIDEMAGYPRVKNIMMGAVDSVNTVGIITAENPHSQQAPKEYNKREQEHLKTDIRSLGYGFIQISGKYGSEENPLFIPNITKAHLIMLGEKHKQESVIFGEKNQDNEKSYFKWELILCETGKASRTVYKNISNERDIESREDFYSAVKNRKFYFPFFDEVEADTQPSKAHSTPLTQKQQSQPVSVGQ
jgi:hypothetical protein